MNNDLISREALKAEFDEKCAGECGVCAYHKWENYGSLNAVSHCLLIDNAPTVNPCKNCDLYLKAMTKAAELDKMPMISKKHKGGAE